MDKRKSEQQSKATKSKDPLSPIVDASKEQNSDSVFSTSDSKVTVRRDGGKVVVSVPVKFYRRNGRQMILADCADPKSNSIEAAIPNSALLTALAKAYVWQEQLESGEFATLEEIATASSVDRTYVGRILQLTSLSPQIVEQILDGNEPDGISLRQLRKGVPCVWSEQR